MKTSAETKYNKLIILLILALACVITAGLFVGSLNSPKTYWSVVATANKPTYAVYELQGTSNVDTVKIYVGEIKRYAEEGAEVQFCFNTSESAVRGSSHVAEFSKYFNPQTSMQYGWTTVCASKAISSRFVKIKVGGTLNIYEVAFFDSNGNKIPFKHLGTKPYDGNYSQNVKGDTAGNVKDEQSTAIFRPSRINSVTSADSDLLKAVKSLINRDGSYVSKNVMPLGVATYSLGVLIFGANTFGIRIISFLAFVAFMWLAYVFCKKLFGKNKNGVLYLALILSSLIAITTALSGTAIALNVLLLLACYYFAYSYYKEGKETSIVLCGLCFALAINVYSASVFALIGLAVIIAIRVIKDKKINVLNTVIAFVVLPIIITLLSVALCSIINYSSYYATANYFAIATKSFASGFKGEWNLSSLKALLGLESQILINEKDSSYIGKLYAFVNPAFTYFVIACTLCACVWYIYGKVNKKPSALSQIIKANTEQLFVMTSAFVSCLAITLFSVKSFGVMGLTWLYACMVGYAVLTLKAIKEFTIVKRNQIVLSVYYALLAVVAIFFLVGFVGAVGFSVKTAFADSLYRWFLA